MRYTPVFLFLTAVVFLGMASCSQHTAELKLPTAPPDIRGSITQVEGASGDLRIMVEENPDDSTASAKASVRVGAQAEILKRRADELQKAGVAELTQGTRVSVWYDGPVLLSYPARAGAKIVVIEQ